MNDLREKIEKILMGKNLVFVYHHQSLQIDKIMSLIAQEKNRWFEKGKNSIMRKNESGCTCKLSEDGEVIESLCELHKEHEKQQVLEWLRK